MRDRIEIKLRDNFAPAVLEVVDESERHRGHGGWREGGETHFRVTMRSARLNGLSRIASQREVHKLLAEEFEGGLHALSLDLSGAAEESA